LAWHPSGKEIWFTAARSGIDRALYGATLQGSTRLVAQVPGGMQLCDISASGDVLINRTTERLMMLTGDLEAGSEQDVSWLDWSRARGITADGGTILFDESGSGGGQGYSAFVYKHSSPSPRRIGTGIAVDLSSDGHWALTRDADDTGQLTLVDTSTGTRTAIGGTGTKYAWVKLAADGREIVFQGESATLSRGVYRKSLPDGAPVLITTAVALDDAILDHAGQTIAGLDESGQLAIVDVRSGRTRRIPLPYSVHPVAFIDHNRIAISRRDENAIRIEVLDLKTGKLSSYDYILVSEPTGLAGILPLYLSRDLRTYVYSRLQNLSDLFVVSGWR
jgi:hypothetical protein